MSNLNILIYISISFFGALMLTYFVMKWALKKAILDIPNDRSSHTMPTPRGGGLAFFVIWYILISILFFQKQIDDNLYYALLCFIPIGIVSIIDDIKNISPSIRLFVQVLAAFFGFFFLEGLHHLDIGNYKFQNTNVLYPVMVIGIVWFVNLYNFLDGIDGYASLEALVVLLTMYFVVNDSLLLILAAAILGFFVWNRPKAKIFMGDIGSTMLGYTLIMLGIYYHNLHAFNIISWLTVTSLFWFDATLTIVRRLINGEKISQAHRKHAYQRIVLYGFSHKKTLLYALAINLLIVCLVFLSYVGGFISKGLSLVVTLTILTIVYYLIEKKYPFRNNK